MATDSLFVLRPNAVKLSMATRDYLGNLERKQLRSRTSSNAFVPRPSSLPPGRRARVPPEPGMVARIQRRPRLYGVCLALLVGLGLLMYSLADVIVLARFKLRDRAYEEGWINGCGMRKRPLLFIRDSESLAIVWETNCAQDFELSYGPVEVPRRKRWTSEDDLVSWAPAKVKKIELEGGRFVYQAVLQDLRRGRHAYKVTESASVLARHTFSWIGSSSAEATTIHFAALSDNQFNLRTFHRLLLSLLSYAKSLPSSPFPSFLLHAGDQVQNPHNLQQWQTDFYEPLTSLLPLPLGQTTPILLARGNHDWDMHGVNAYTGGTPPRLDWLQHMSRKPRVHHPGTFYSYSPHQRVRFLVLDSNLVEEEDQLEQEEWLLWELERPEWTEASLRVVVVHVPPFLEFWDRTAWTAGKENQWSVSHYECCRAEDLPGRSTCAIDSRRCSPSTAPRSYFLAIRTRTLADSSQQTSIARTRPRPTRPPSHPLLSQLPLSGHGRRPGARKTSRERCTPSLAVRAAVSTSIESSSGASTRGASRSSITLCGSSWYWDRSRRQMGARDGRIGWQGGENVGRMNARSRTSWSGLRSDNDVRCSTAFASSCPAALQSKLAKSHLLLRLMPSPRTAGAFRG